MFSKFFLCVLHAVRGSQGCCWATCCCSCTGARIAEWQLLKGTPGGATLLQWGQLALGRTMFGQAWKAPRMEPAQPFRSISSTAWLFSQWKSFFFVQHLPDASHLPLLQWKAWLENCLVGTGRPLGRFPKTFQSPACPSPWCSLPSAARAPVWPHLPCVRTNWRQRSRWGVLSRGAQISACQQSPRLEHPSITWDWWKPPLVHKTRCFTAESSQVGHWVKSMLTPCSHFILHVPQKQLWDYFRSFPTNWSHITWPTASLMVPLAFFEHKCNICLQSSEL